MGDTILFSHHKNLEEKSFIKRIKSILPFSTFEKALHVLPLEQVLPKVSSIQEGIKVYLQYVSLETQTLKGVCMIELEEESFENLQARRTPEFRIPRLA